MGSDPIVRADGEVVFSQRHPREDRARRHGVMFAILGVLVLSGLGAHLADIVGRAM